MSLADTLSRCDTTAFVTAIALVAEAKRRERRPTMAEIKRLVCARFGVTPAEMQSDRRPLRISRPRQIGMYLSHQLTERSWRQIGIAFGRKHHSTVMYAARNIETRRAADPEIEAAVRELTAELSIPRRDTAHNQGA